MSLIQLQRSAGNAAVQRWLRASGPRLMRVEVKCFDTQGKPITLETEEKSLSELAAIALHKKNAGNAALQSEFSKRARRCTEQDILDLLRSFNLGKLLNKDSPLKDTVGIEKAIEALIAALTFECKTEESVVARLGATAALALTQVWRDHGKRYPRLVTAAKEGTVRERELRDRNERAQQETRDIERCEKQKPLIRLLARNMAEFLQIIETHGLPEGLILAQLKALDALADTMLEMLRASKFATEELVRIANGLSVQVNQIIHILELTLNPLEPSPFDEPLYEEYDYEIELRRRQVAKILSAHLPGLIGLLNINGQHVVRLRYRGSLTDALKNATKSTTLGNIAMARVMNLNEFDADAFLEVTDEIWDMWDRLGLLPKPLVGGKAGLRAVHQHLAFYMNPTNQAKIPAERLKTALDLRERIGIALKIEEQIKLELMEVQGYKREKPKAQSGSSSSSKAEEDAPPTKTVESTSSKTKAKNRLPADFGFVIQPMKVTQGQATTGKPYALGLLSGLGLRILELRSVIVADKDTLVVKLPEPTETIDLRGFGSRPRAYSI